MKFIQLLIIITVILLIDIAYVDFRHTHIPIEETLKDGINRLQPYNKYLFKSEMNINKIQAEQLEFETRFKNGSRNYKFLVSYFENVYGYKPENIVISIEHGKTILKVYTKERIE